MNENENAYLLKFRELVAKKNAIEMMIVEFRKICESLNDWQKTASEISLPGNSYTNPTWSEKSLKEFFAIRSFLVEYNGQKEAITILWSKLTASEKIGLLSPDKI